MTVTQTNFLGIPVDGDITKPDRRVPQRPLSDLEPMIRAVLADEGIVDFGWNQYTPYFNDGDPCVFGVGELWFRTAAEVDPDDGPDDGPDDTYGLELSGHPSLSVQRWDRAAREYVPIERDDETKARYQRCKELSAAIGSGAFDDVLLEAFGDHAQVRVRKDRIVIDEYSHD